MKTQEIEVSKIRHNTGQIDGLPPNPRTIKDESYERLLDSIKETPEMLELRELIVYPHKNIFVVIGGNKRFSAAKDLKHKKVPCKILPKDTSIETLKAITIKDNISAGEWDFAALRLDWDEDQLKNWGLDMPIIEDEGGDEILDDLSDKIQSQFRIEVVCKSEEEQEKLYNKFIEMGLDCRLLTI